MEETAKKEGRPGIFASIKALRSGQWMRLVAVLVCLVGLVLYLALPQIIIQYQVYDTTVVTGDRVIEQFPVELISGINNFFGGTPFAYYKNSEYQGVEVLVSQVAKFNWFALGMFVLALAACGMSVWLNFTKKNEKWAKLVILFYVLCGLMVVMGPIWFLASNGFGGADFTENTDASRYWNYYQLYVHDAYGALVSGLVILVAGICFGIGTSLEGGDKNDVRNQD